MTRVFLPHVITDDSALGGSDIQRSLRFIRSDSHKLNRTFGTNTSNTTKTLSFWMKRGTMGAYQTIFGTTASGYIEGRFQFTNTDELQFVGRDASDGTTDVNKATNRKFRDVGAWYHIVLTLDSTDSTADDRVKIYVNGVRETSFSSSTNPPSSYSFSFYRSSVGNFIGANDSSDFFDGYLAEINFIDGQALDASYFGYTEFQTGLWRPKRHTGSYGTNGFRLEFKDNSGTTATTLGKDTSRNGNANNWTPNNFSVSAGVGNDSMIDTPTHNYATLNPLHWNVLYGSGGTSNGADYTNANLRFVSPSDVTSPYNRQAASTISVDSGKWYFEATQEHSDNGVTIGFSEDGAIDSNGYYTGSWGFNPFDQRYMIAGTETSYGAKASNGDVCGFAFDLDNNTMQLFINNSGQGVVTGLGISGKRVLMTAKIAFWTNKWVFNFGQQGFAYTPPTGYKALESSNVPPNVPSIIRPQRHFDTLTYTGDGSSNHLITGLEFKPDLVWIKSRSQNSSNHGIHDSVRKDSGNTTILYTNSTAVENAGGSYMLSQNGFVSNGIRVNNNISGNNNGETYVAWCWKAGGAAVSNSDGNNTSSVSANQEAGFSILTYTGTGANNTNVTMGHGLGVTPDVVIIKNRDSSSNWVTWHKNLSTDGTYVNNNIFLNTTAAETYYSSQFRETNASTITVRDVDSDGNVKVNKNGDNYVAYCWAEIPGYSKFGSYTSNNSTDGPFINLGFKPAFVVFKGVTDAVDWVLYDNKRNTYNQVGSLLQPSNTDDEYSTGVNIDFVSNGVKIRADSGYMNNPNNKKFIYMAFAEQPGFTPFGTFPNPR